MVSVGDSTGFTSDIIIGISYAFIFILILVYIASLLLDEFKKFAILRKGIGIKSQNLCKQFNDQKTIETRWNSIVWLL